MPTTLVEPAVVLLREKVSARVFLLSEGEETTKRLAQALDDHGVLGSLPGALSGVSKAARRALGGQIAVAADGLLNLDFSDLLLSGWCKHRALVAAARRTMATPGSEEIVDLCTHHIRSTHKPYVDLVVDEFKVTCINFEVCLEFTVKGAVALVRSGRLIAVRSGDCDATGSLKVEGAQVCSRDGHFELPLLLHLGDDGLSLLRTPDLPKPRPPTDVAPSATETSSAPRREDGHGPTLAWDEVG